MDACVILNPEAGSAAEADNLRHVIQSFGDVTLRETAKRGEATHFAAQALRDGCDLVVAAGGDGTINEVVNGLSENWASARLGILPLGTGNDFVRTIGVPKEVTAAVETILRDDARPLDVVCAESDRTRYFLNVSAGGFSGMVDERLTDEVKATWGPLSYLRAAVTALPDLTNYHMLIGFDDDEPITLIAYNVVVANARYVAGGVPIVPSAIVDDGKVDVVIIPAASIPRLATLVPLILLGRHLDSPYLTCRRVRKVHVEAQPGMWFNTDGEMVGKEPITFTVLPRALRVIVGPGFDAGGGA